MSELEDLARGTGADARAARRTLKRRASAAASGRSDADDFAPLLDLVGNLDGRLTAAALRALGRRIAGDLRATNAKRLKTNVTPAGEPMVPRKAKANGRRRTRRLRDEATRTRGSVKMGAMFQRAVAPRYLRKESSKGEAQVGFVGAMARIMRVHHYGLRDTVTRDPASPEVTYPSRAVIGLTPDDRLRILDALDAQIAP